MEIERLTASISRIQQVITQECMGLQHQPFVDQDAVRLLSLMDHFYNRLGDMNRELTARRP